jgi:tetratricopeptide (TPR) repeat protein
VEQSPADARSVLMLANSLVNRGVSLIALNQFAEAERLYERAIALHKGQLSKAPDNFLAKQDLALSYDDLGDLYWNRRRAAEAEQMCRQSYDMRMELWRVAPSDATSRYFLSRSCRNLGKIYSESGRTELAIQSYGQAIGLLEQLRNEHADIPMYPLELAYCYRRRSLVTGDVADYSKATQEYRRTLRVNPNIASIANSLAWHLATGKNPSEKDTHEAVTLAKKAVNLIPDASTYWNTLGVAHYRMKEWNESVQALQKSIELGKQRDISNWFFLALAFHQKGDTAQARRWFDEGVELLEQASAPNLETNRFRDEALALLNPSSAATLPSH